MSSSTSKPSAQLSVVLRWYEAVSNWKFDVLEEVFSEDYKHETLPSTVNDPQKNKAQGIEFAKSMGKLLGYTPLQVRRAFINWGRNHVPPQYEIFRLSETPGHIWVHVRPIYSVHTRASLTSLHHTVEAVRQYARWHRIQYRIYFHLHAQRWEQHPDHRYP